jgi:hypothetical protein
VKFRPLAITLACCLAGTPLHADWKEEIGFTRLQLLAGAELPTAPDAGLTQVEAPEGANYTPNISSTLFTGKLLNLKSGASGTSNHAQHVATNFYATTSQLPGSCVVDLYNANNWDSDFINQVASNPPATETRAVQNHSWIFTPNPDAVPPVAPLSEATVVNFNKRLDYAIDRDGFVCVVGENNGSSTTLPQLLGQSYNTISVGRDDGAHSAGFTAHDGAGRIKPDIVAPSTNPEYATSWTTPMVAGAAGLLYQKLTSSYSLSSAADRPRVIKALLLATATKNTVPGWDNTSSRPLDDIYGAGELNIHHAYLALRAGKATAGTQQYGIRGWAAESVNGTTKTYYFTIPPGAPSTPFCATLIWHRSINSTITWSQIFANLNLEFHHASGSTLGSLITTSTSTVDNVELVYQSALPPGDYALVVSKISGTATPYALAWHSLPAVTVVATTPTSREIDGQTGLVTLTRTGDTTLPLYVPLSIGGTAVAGSHYQTLPSSVTIPAGQTSATLQITPVSDNIAQGDRSVTVSVAADFALVSNPAQTAVVTIQDKPFDDWRFARFTAPELANPAISGETADPDADLLPNLIEYALGLEPKSPDTSPVAMIDSGGYLALSATKNPTATDITWSAETSADLETWASAVVVTNNTNSFEARDSVLMNAAEKRFIRLKITRP